MKTKHLPLIVGICLPVIFIIIISIVIFTPALFIKPQHNFIYTTKDSYYTYNQEYKNTYKVENGRVVFEPIISRENIVQTKISPTLYLYDVRTNSSHQVTFEEVQQYLIDPGPSSPDGYTVTYQREYDGIFELFGSNNDNNDYFISKGSRKKKLNGLTGDRYYSPRNFKLIGWIK